MRTVRDIPVLMNIPVLVRVALNAPVENGKVVDTFRLRRALPTITYLQQKGAKVILISHVTGESHGSGVGTETLVPMREAMKTFIPRIAFCPVSTGPEARSAIHALHPGEVLMLENLRRHAGEMKNDSAFAKALAELADVFVQDSFDTCHREHASIVGVPTLLPSYAGLLVEEEVMELTKALAPKRPSLAIICGAKFSTKEPVITRLLPRYDRVFVGGALANDFMKASGHPVGTSLVSDTDATHFQALLKHPHLLLPLDYVVAPRGARRDAGRIADIDDVKEHEAILDNGPKTIAMLAEIIATAGTLLWNGPLGNYENGFTEGTEALARAVAASKTYSIVGGGDTVAAIETLHLNDRFSFISTGGGAMLDFLAKGTLPGLQVLQ